MQPSMLHSCSLRYFANLCFYPAVTLIVLQAWQRIYQTKQVTLGFTMVMEKLALALFFCYFLNEQEFTS